MEHKNWISAPKPIAILALSAAISLVQVDIKSVVAPIAAAHADEGGESAYKPFLEMNPETILDILTKNTDKTIIVMFSSAACHPCEDLAREMAKNQSDDHLFVIVKLGPDYSPGDKYFEKGKWADIADEFFSLLGSPNGMPNGTPFVTYLRYDGKKKIWFGRALKAGKKFDKKHPAEHWMQAIRPLFKK